MNGTENIALKIEEKKEKAKENSPTAAESPVGAKEEKKATGEKNGKKQEINDGERAPFFQLFRLAGALEIAFMIFGSLCALGVGVCSPLIGVVFGSAIGKFKKTASADSVLDNVAEMSLWMIYIGIANLGLSCFTEALWTSVGERLGIKMRRLYLGAVMKKDVTWFDLNKPQQLPTTIASLVSKFQGGIGEKIGKVVISIGMFVAGIVVAFVYGWQLALVLLGISPLSFFAAKMISYANSRGAETTKESYNKCGGYAEEALSQIRTVYALCGSQEEVVKYTKELGIVEEVSIQNSLYLGIAIGMINLAMALSHGLGYLIGSFFIEHEVYNSFYEENYTCSSVMTVFFCGLFASFSMGMIAPHLKSIDEARLSAFDLYKVIDEVESTKPKHNKKPIVPFDKDSFKGKIEFKEVTFSYPTNPGVKVLKNFSAVFEARSTTGICGETGSGKSTIIQLLERFFDPDSGTIEADGVDISTIELTTWRELIGYVGQEPVLFNTTISKNIAYGKETATMQEIQLAAKQSNITEFVGELEDGFETICGSEGGQLSGGQKQRIAIARALIKKPRIMLLDEATSALDNTSEASVQKELLNLQKEVGMTTIVIAHRLSTIKRADKIIVLHDGEKKEEGTDETLNKADTMYGNLCRVQGEIKEDVVAAERKFSDGKRLQSVGKNVSIAERKAEKRKLKLLKTIFDTGNAIQMRTMMMLKVKDYSSKIWGESLQFKARMIIAMIMAGLGGFYMPTIGTLFGMVSMDLLLPSKTELREQVNLDFAGFVIAGASMFCISIVMFKLFGYVAAKVTHNLRDTLYKHIFTMSIGWFDLPTNLPHVLNNVLSEGTENINGVVRMNASIVIQSLSALVVALIIAFVFSWRMALLVLGCVPIMGLSGFIHTKFHQGFSKQSEELYKMSTGILSEAVKNFRTVASFSSEKRIVKMYSDALESPLATTQCSAVVSGIFFGIGQLLPSLIYAGVFYFNALFNKNYEIKPRDSFIALYALIFSAMTIGQLQQYAPDMGKAYGSLFSIYSILEQRSAILPNENAKKTPLEGKIEFKNVTFKYPTRTDEVLKGFNMTVLPGQQVAIVGMSGSGKSTIAQLIERFYDVVSGEILIDGVNIKEFDLDHLRDSIGYVAQEPALFDSTILENITYARKDASWEEIKHACDVAHASSIINAKTAKMLGEKDNPSNKVLGIFISL